MAAAGGSPRPGIPWSRSRIFWSNLWYFLDDGLGVFLLFAPLAPVLLVAWLMGL